MLVLMSTAKIMRFHSHFIHFHSFNFLHFLSCTFISITKNHPIIYLKKNSFIHFYLRFDYLLIVFVVVIAAAVTHLNGDPFFCVCACANLSVSRHLCCCSLCLSYSLIRLQNITSIDFIWFCRCPFRMLQLLLLL